MLIDIHHIFSVVDQLLVLYVLIRSLDLRRWQSMKKKLLDKKWTTSESYLPSIDGPISFVNLYFHLVIFEFHLY